MPAVLCAVVTQFVSIVAVDFGEFCSILTIADSVGVVHKLFDVVISDT
jgi:hypothetical protein